MAGGILKRWDEAELAWKQVGLTADLDQFVTKTEVAILQIIEAVSTTNDSTTSTGYQNSSLVASITPKRSNSLLIVETSGAGEARGSSNALDRVGVYRLRNETDDVILQGAEEHRLGRALVSTSAEAADSFFPVVLRGRYTVNSTITRTFRLQYRSTSAAVSARIRGDRAAAIMTILEIAL